MPVDWDRKLAQGEAFEQRIIKLFESQGHQAWKPTDRKYDLRINIEVPYYGSLALTGECKWIVRTSFVRSMVETLNLRPIETGDVGMRARCVLVPIEQARKLVGGTWLTL